MSNGMRSANHDIIYLLTQLNSTQILKINDLAELSPAMFYSYLFKKIYW